MAEHDRDEEREHIDVAVVGGGVSGLYCCWRLRQSGRARDPRGKPREPVLFEMSDRSGGRLYSLPVPGIPNVMGELGGMRFLLDAHRIVTELAKQLELTIAEFPVAGPNNIYALRGAQLRDASFKHPEKVPYAVLDSERGLKPVELLVKAIETVVPNASKLNVHEWEQVKQTAMWNGDKLCNWGLWNVLLSSNNGAPGNPRPPAGVPVLSSEAYALLYDGMGYQSLVDNWNCAEAFQFLLSDFYTGAKYSRLAEGYQKLTDKLGKEFKRAGGIVYMKNRLQSFVVRHTKLGLVVDLDVADDWNGVVRRYRANALILAMPQRSLQILAERTPILNRPEIQGLLKSVMPLPAYKALLAYPKPWWREPPLGIEGGRSTTDLPIRQVYYLDTAAEPNNKNSLMLATYVDGRTESFWRGLWDGQNYPMQPNQSVKGPADVTPGWPLAPKDFIDTLQELLVRMHALPKIPDPYFASIKDWTEDPYGGGWHFWRPNVKVWETLPRVRQPLGDAPVYICGEAYSNQQGWVEGALTSAEHVLEDHFGLDRPLWLPADYFMGP